MKSREVFNFKKIWRENYDVFQRTWFCKRCGRWCPNCAGRTCFMCCVHRIEASHYPFDPELRPAPFGSTHQDSVFTNSFQTKPYYVVHPEWNSEVVNDPRPKPLDRPPWPWEQPRYRVNMNLPTTYVLPGQVLQGKEEEKKEEEEEYNYAAEVPPLSYQLTQAYRSTHPAYVVRY